MISQKAATGVVCATPPWPFKDKSQADIYHDLSILFKKNRIWMECIWETLNWWTATRELRKTPDTTLLSRTPDLQWKKRGSRPIPE